MAGVHLQTEKAGWLITYSISGSQSFVSTTDLPMICVCVSNSAPCVGTVNSYLRNGIPTSPSAVSSFCQLIVNLPDRRNEGEWDGASAALEIWCDVAA